MKILLISGHGAGDTGATSSYGVEATETRTMATLIRERLSKYAEVTLYPQDRNCYQDNKNGKLQVNFSDFDYVLETHMNQSAESRRGLGNGFEVLVHESISGVSVEKAIAKEIAKVGFELRRDSGIYRTSGFLNMETCLRLGVDYALVETCFIDSASDMAIYSAKKEAIADAYVAGIVAGFGLTESSSVTETPNEDAVKLRSMSTEEFIEYIGLKATEDQQKTGILACVTVAQAMLESGNGKTELACGNGASEANIAENQTAYGARNLFGMKTTISEGTWESTVWNGKKYRKQTAEQSADGTYTNIWADFRAYDTVDDSISDHSQYLLKARLSAGGELRYAGMVGETDYTKAIDILCAGGYATSLSYKTNLIKRIETYNLCRFNATSDVAYEEWTAKVTNATALNVRESPNGEVMQLSLSTLPSIVVIGEEKDSDGDTWYKVRVGDSTIGYVWTEYLSK
jgi:flagellum-specific peptidoglycan hydrolase FlgJ